MSQYKLAKDKLPDFLNSLNDYQVFAPADTPEGVRYIEMEDPGAVTLDFKNTTMPPKSLMFPQTETLFRYRVGEGEIEPPHAEEKPRVIFAIRPCDAQSFTIVDNLFRWDYIDTYYSRRRENTTLVGFACEEPCVNCFCTSMGGGPDFKDPLDVIFYDLGDVLYLEALTDAGEDLMGKAAGLEEAGDEERKRAEAQAREATGKIVRELDTEGVPDKLPGLWEHPMWDQIASACLGCGICTFLCPTCHCFDMQDEVEVHEGRRARMWDSCMFSEYTLHASGHNPRPTRAERTRNRVCHKYSYFVDHFDVIACVGCGRCINYCPVNIDIIDIIEQARAAKVKEEEKA